MPSEMIERVAKAMYDAWGRNAATIYPGQWIDHKPWEDADKRMYLIQARAAIEAMREPTPQQITEGYGALLADSTKNGYDNRTDDKKLERMREFYRATIDAALTTSAPA